MFVCVYVCVCLCVSVALVIHQAKRMRHVILSYLTCPALPYFSTSSHKRHDFREKKLLNVKYVFISSTPAFLKLFSSGDHFHQSECSTDHPTLGIIKLIRPALNSVLKMSLQQKIPLLLLRVE